MMSEDLKEQKRRERKAGKRAARYAKLLTLPRRTFVNQYTQELVERMNRYMFPMKPKEIVRQILTRNERKTMNQQYVRSLRVRRNVGPSSLSR
jgi:hypothetical protein